MFVFLWLTSLSMIISRSQILLMNLFYIQISQLVSIIYEWDFLVDMIPFYIFCLFVQLGLLHFFLFW